MAASGNPNQHQAASTSVRDTAECQKNLGSCVDGLIPEVNQTREMCKGRLDEMLDTRSFIPPVLNARASITRPAHLLTPVTAAAAAAAAGGCASANTLARISRVYGILMTANAFAKSAEVK